MHYRYSLLLAVIFCLANSLFANNYQIVEKHYFSEESVIPNYIEFSEDGMPALSELDQILSTYWKGNEAFDLRLKDEFEDQQGEVHLKYVQTFQGVDIEFAEWIIHTKNGRIRAMNGQLLAKLPSNNEKGISEEAALQAAKDKIGADTYKWELLAEQNFLKMIENDPSATYYPKAELAYMSPDLDLNADNLRLCYKFNIYAHEPMSRYEVYVDAASAEIIFMNSLIHTADVRSTANTGYSGQRTITSDSLSSNSFRLRQTLLGNGVNTYDMNQGTTFGNAVDFTNSSSSWNITNAQLDQYALDAHWGAEQTYQYFNIQFNRNSINNNGFALNSYVHYSSNYVNAFWNGQYMTYGDGNSNVTPLTALDIAGHEITHGLTNFTADLIYQRESGALNESFSDIFGTAIEIWSRPSRSNWTMGEDIGFALRSMSNPNLYNDPDTYGGTNWLNQVGCVPSNQNDLCGVHINSGVQNFWFYLLSQGGTGTNDLSNSYSVSSIGINKAAAIAYRNLTVYLGRSSDFQQARFYSIRSAVDLYGACSPEVEAVTRAWYAVGVGPNYVNGVVADFVSSDTVSCQAPLTVSFFDESINGLSYDWDFGDGNTDTVRSPIHTYTSLGNYNVQLIVDGGNCGIDTLLRSNYVDIDTTNLCVAILGNGRNPKQIECNGKLLDSGGSTGNYTNNESGSITIEPPGASSVTIRFPFFDVEQGSNNSVCDYDFIEVFDGDSTNAISLGKFCNNQLPPSTITSTRGAITIRFSSDAGLVRQGFEIDWTCNYPSAAPTADFAFDIDSTCTGEVNFIDQSSQSPNNWLWDFGDGTTSNLQDPSHTYTLDGTYSVTLTTTNSFGSDTEIKSNIIFVDRPAGPAVTNDTVCFGQTANLSVSGSGDLRWYTDEFVGNPINTGNNLSINQPANDSIFWVEDYISPPVSIAGPANNNFGTGGNYNGDQYLVFDVYKTMVLEDVFVYPSRPGNRIIELRDNNGQVLQSKTVYIASGTIVNLSLDFTIPPGTDYRLGVNVNNGGPDLYRNSSGASYPYTVPGLMSIKRSSANTNPTGYYYFFYYWRVKELDCVSPRVPVIAYLDTTCSITGLEEQLSLEEVQIYPNPAKDQLNLFVPAHDGQLEIGLWSLEGRKVKDLYVSNSSNGRRTQSIDISDLSAGVYLARITNQAKTKTIRLVIF